MILTLLIAIEALIYFLQHPDSQEHSPELEQLEHFPHSQAIVIVDLSFQKLKSKKKM